MTSSGLSSLSLYNNYAYQALIRPLYVRDAYKSQLANYDTIDDIVDKMNPSGSEGVDDSEYNIGTTPAIRTAYYVKQNSQVLPGDILEVTMAVNPDIDLRNVYRVSETVMDKNYNKGRIVRVESDKIYLERNTSVAWNTSTMFTTDSSVGVYGNAQLNSNSGAMSSIEGIPTFDKAYVQTFRANYSTSRAEFIKPTWLTTDGTYWQNFQIEQEVERMLKNICLTNYYGSAYKKGTGNNTLYYMEGIRDAVRLRNPEMFHQLQTPLTEAIFQQKITEYVQLTNSKVREVFCDVGVYQYANFQSFMAKYLVTAGQNNTFGGVDVSGLNITMYDFCGLRLAVRVSSLFGDTQWNPSRSQIQDGVKTGFTVFIYSTKKVETDKGYVNPIIKKHLGPKASQTGFIRGLVEPEIIMNGSGADLAARSLSMDEMQMPITSLQDTFTFYHYQTHSLQIDPKNFMIIEYEF